MPRLRKRPLGTPTTEAIIGAEVDGMFRAVLPEGPWPDEDSCLLIAEFLTGNLDLWGGTEAQKKQRRKVVNAVKVLREYINASYSESDANDVRWIDADLFELDKILGSLRRSFRSPPTYKPWVPTMFPVVEVFGGVLEELGHHAGRARGSAAVKISVLALRRMGHTGVTAAAVASWLARKPKSPA